MYTPFESDLIYNVGQEQTRPRTAIAAKLGYKREQPDLYNLFYFLSRGFQEQDKSSDVE